MIEDYERPDDKEGMGCIAWTMATIALAIALAMFSCGCEDEGDHTTVNEAPDVPEDQAAIVVDGNTGVVVVDNKTSPDSENPSIIIHGNTGKVYVTSSPYEPPEPEPAP
jgi:ABC-type uncharacterized transport system auxiliary subunit